MPLPNKPGEPDFKLKLEPADKINFKFKSGEEITVDLKITNPLKDRASFKVKCTDNDIFRVRPPLGFVKPNETTVVKITLKSKAAPDPQRHFFAIYHVTCSDSKTTARAVWTADTKAEGVIRLQATVDDAEKEKEKEKKPEEGGGKEEEKEKKKEEEKKEEGGGGGGGGGGGEKKPEEEKK